MNTVLGDPELSGVIRAKPKYPSMVSMDITPAARGLHMHTNNLRSLSAPLELCVQKALELVSDRNNYHFNLDLFKMELLADAIDSTSINDVSSLINGIRTVGDFLIKSLEDLSGEHIVIYPYQFYKLINMQLFMSIIETDDPSQLLPTCITMPKPAYMYRDMQSQTREDYFTEASEPVVLR